MKCCMWWQTTVWKCIMWTNHERVEQLAFTFFFRLCGTTTPEHCFVVEMRPVFWTAHEFNIRIHNSQCSQGKQPQVWSNPSKVWKHPRWLRAQCEEADPWPLLQPVSIMASSNNIDRPRVPTSSLLTRPVHLTVQTKTCAVPVNPD